MKNTNTTIENFKRINNFIEKNKTNLFKATSDKVFDLTGPKFINKIETVVSADGVLRIGIVGQVKAGKSSFINALLFDGKDILPKASTPMTAALTVIKYSSEIYAEVEFYSDDDWAIIKNKAQEYEKLYQKIEEELKISTAKEIETEINKRSGDSLASAYEVYTMARKSKVDIESFIGKKEKISKKISSVNELVGKLQNYVGVDGEYTSITRNINLYLDLPSLKEIEIIDTPGTNDPIVSRGHTTRDFLSKCDTVFLLSYSGQFMGKEDAEFLTNTLPSEGISNIILLGSKFDSVLIDEYKNYQGNIRQALQNLYTKLSSQADDSLGKIIDFNPNKPISEKIKNKKVKFISAICYNIAKKDKINLDEIETHTLNLLEQRYNLEFSNDTLFELANIDSIKNKDLQDIKNNKDKILSSKLDDFIRGQTKQVFEALVELEKNIIIHLDELENSNIEELSTKAKNLEEGFDKAKSGINQVFLDFNFDIKDKINQLIQEITNQRSNYIGVSKSTATKEVFSHTTGIWFWEESHYETVYYDVANVNEAVDKATNFISVINNSINKNWNKIINLNNIEKQLIIEAQKGFDLSSTSFDKNKIINPIKNALREIQIKPFRLKDKQYINKIISHFSSHKVTGSDISKLENELIEVLYAVSEDVEQALDEKINEISILINSKKDTFVLSIKEDSNKSIAKLKNDLQNKEASKNKYISLVAEIDTLKNGI